jgi:hypothetical protein
VVRPLLSYLYAPIELKEIRQFLQYLPIFSHKKRDDHIYGASRYVANTLGIMLCDNNISELIDVPMDHTAKKQLWRIATFYCRCTREHTHYHNFGIRTFCKTCACLIHREKNNIILHETRCPACNINESWQTLGHPCLACQFASVVYQNPFAKRFQNQLRIWLHQNGDSDKEDDDSTICSHQNTQPNNTNYPTHAEDQEQELYLKRSQNIEKIFQDLRKQHTRMDTKYVFEDLNLLQEDLHNNHKHLATKLPAKRNYRATNDEVPITEENNMAYTARTPFREIDINTLDTSKSNQMLKPKFNVNYTPSYNNFSTAKKDRMKRIKAQKFKAASSSGK